MCDELLIGSTVSHDDILGRLRGSYCAVNPPSAR